MGPDAGRVLDSEGPGRDRRTAAHPRGPQRRSQRSGVESLRNAAGQLLVGGQHPPVLPDGNSHLIQTNNIHELEYAEDIEYLREQCFA